MKNNFKSLSIIIFICSLSCILSGCSDVQELSSILLKIDNLQIIMTIITLSLATSYIFPRFANYLNESKEINSSNKIIDIERELANLKEAKIATTLKISDQEKAEIIKNLNNQFEEKITNDYFLKLEANLKVKNLEDFTERSLHRLKDEILSLGRRGTVNLFIGITLSLFGVIYLISTMSSSASYTEYEKLVSYFLPRTLIVIFIEFFSFFFLNLYKKSLDEIKYFQNEVTNLEAKYLALAIAKQSGNFKLISNALAQLLKTERNFVLKKDETTIELEKNKIEAQSSNSTIQALKDTINFKR